MSFLRPFSFADVLPPLQGRSVELRAPEMRDFEAWAALRAASREFLRPWEPTWPPNDLTRMAFRARLKRYSQDVRADAAYPFFIFRQSDGALVGGLTLGQIRRGVAQTASLGYWMGQAHAGQGYMSDAVRTMLPYAFNGLRLRRVEAACLPENEPSIRLLEKVGFIREGYARSYLCIAGSWRDHLLYAILADDPIR
ncbi:GNAT family N-acetyltransferase [Labrys okinawensis]|uniref:GNAT family N-acetyltransferase n=1 Tax=Labrys okinawensis TaxID=346911 RepID=UPI0039BCA822